MADGLLFKRGGSGGTDISDTTAVAADVADGKYFYTAAGIKTMGTMLVDKESTVLITVSLPLTCSVSSEVADV